VVIECTNGETIELSTDSHNSSYLPNYPQRYCKAIILPEDPIIPGNNYSRFTTYATAGYSLYIDDLYRTIDASLSNYILARGSSGSKVMTLQELLQRKGYFNINPTGFFEKITENAVIRFQRDNNLTPNGKVGSETWNALNRRESSTAFFPIPTFSASNPYPVSNPSYPAPPLNASDR